MVDFSAPFNPLIASEQNASTGNPLALVNQAAQTRTALANSNTAISQADDAALQNAQNHFSYIINGMTPLLAKGSAVTAQDVASAGADIVAETKGRVSANEIAGFIKELPTDGPGIQQALQQHQLRLMNAQQQIATLRGQTEAYNTGGTTQFGTRNAYNGAYQPQGGASGQLTNTLSPEAAVTPQSGPPDPNTGAPTTITGGERAEGAGLAAAGTYTGRGGGPQQVYVSPSGQITRRPQGLGTPMAPRAGGPMQVAPSPGQGIALKAGGEQYAQAGQNASTYGQQMTQLQSALTGLQGTTTGPGTESRQAIASYMLALPGGIGQYLPGVDPKSVQAYDEANKYLTQTAQGSPNATRSDAGLNTALASSPSVHISNAAAQDVLKANMGFRRAEMANYAAFQRSGQDPGQFQSFMAQRNQQIDPRAYTVDLLSPAQRASFMQSLSPAAKMKFLGSVRDAMGSGMIDTSALQGGAAGGR